MKIHVYHHFPQPDHDSKLNLVIDLIRRVENKLDIMNEDPTGKLKQEIMDKLNTIIQDVKTTI